MLHRVRGNELPTLFIDVSTIVNGDSRTGIQRVVRGILSNIANEVPREIKIVPVFARKWRKYRSAHYSIDDGILSFVKGPPVRPERGDWFLALDLTAHVLPRHSRQVMDWKQRGLRFSVILYDLLPIQSPQWFSERGVKNFCKWFEFIAREADDLCCISNHVMNSLAAIMQNRGISPSSQQNIFSFSLGSDLLSTLPSTTGARSAQTALGDILCKRFILMVGTVEPRKGYDAALCGFEKLWSNSSDPTITLVIVGQPGWKTSDLQMRIKSHPELGKRLFWLSEASDDELLTLYRSCHGVLVASYDEGYGLPLVEALSYHKPVLARDLPVFREFRHPDIRYFSNDEALHAGGVVLEFLTTGGSRTTQWCPATWRESAHELAQKIGINLN